MIEVNNFETFSGVKLLNQNVPEDQRGSFTKIFQKRGLLPEYSIEQVNYVKTAQKNTIRGLHYQMKEYAESKIFRVVKGSIYCLFVDLRANHRTFATGGKCFLDKSSQAILLPRGFATGYLTMEDHCEVLYLSDNIYNAEFEGGIRWDDPKLEFDLPNASHLLSEKDRNWANLPNNFAGIL